MAWDASKPENDMLLINFPAACRANWDAIALGTDAALLITNAKISASAAIADTKLAQITTAAKVSGAAITLLTSVPAGAGVLPAANSPCKLKADASDTTPQYLDSLINTDVFEITAGDLLDLKDGGVEMEKLEGGSASPGNTKYYGTDASGVAGFHSVFPSGLIGIWSGAISAIPSGWVICDGNNGTPNLTDRFVIHADADSGGTNDVGDTGGAKTVDISHQHSLPAPGSWPAPSFHRETGYLPTTRASDYQDWGIDSAPSVQSGGNSALSVRDKYYALAYIMKT